MFSNNQAIVVILSVVVVIVQSRVSYDGYKLLSVVAKDTSQRTLLRDIELMDLSGVDFWSQITKNTKNSIDIMVSPVAREQLEGLLKNYGLDYSIKMQNIEDVIQSEKTSNDYGRAKSKLRWSINSSSGPDFNYYWRHTEINSYLQELEVKYPKLVKLVNIGQSFEKRDIYAIEVSTATGGITGERPIIFVDATLHAREWIAPMVALGLIYELVEQSGNHSDLLNTVDWIIVPIVNVDGYEFSHTDDRMWRKTRSVTADSSCVGVDPNRNFEYKWETGTGTSDDPCSDVFRGKSAHSEPEVQHLSSYLRKYQNIKLYLTMHSYGNYLIYPYAYAAVIIENSKDHEDIGSRMKETIYKKRGTSYELGNVAITLYAASGGSDDYAVGVAGAEMAFTIELPGNGNGFELPPKEIMGVISETIPGIIEGGKYIAEKYKSRTL